MTRIDKISNEYIRGTAQIRRFGENIRGGLDMYRGKIMGIWWNGGVVERRAETFRWLVSECWRECSSVMMSKGLCKVKKIQRIKKNLDGAHPTHPHPIQTFLENHH